jgi:3-phosphoshikimate 1-carboxyvinyltransferase
VNVQTLRLATSTADKMADKMAAKRALKGVLAVPGDKSISHRALIFSALSKGRSEVHQLSPAEDCQSSLQCLSKLGLKFRKIEKPAKITEVPGSHGSDDNDSASWEIISPGLDALKEPQETLYAGNSGTTIRLMAGLVAGRSFACQFDGDASLRSRPMARVLDHLQSMGAKISFPENAGRAPFTIEGNKLIGRHFELKVASAQVETALLLAGLQADGKTSVKLPTLARDHTVRMFTHMGVPFNKEPDGSISVEKLKQPVKEFAIHVPGDISSAAFFMVGAACLPGSDILLKNVGVSPGRTLVIEILRRMGSDITLINERIVCGEEIADIKVVGSKRLKGTTVSADEVAQGVDEIPILALAGSLCDGTFTVQGASELRHKESDRLALITKNFAAAGCSIEEFEDGFTITGKETIAGGSPWATLLDHRLAMTGQVASLVFENALMLEETASAAISYPTFSEDLALLVSNGLISSSSYE